MSIERLKIAVVGGGISGLVAAYLLDRQHDVTLFEKEEKLGGHTNTIVLGSGPDAGTPVDTGFIVCNPPCYPTFYRFLDQLGVGLRDSDMSWSFHCRETGFGYIGPKLKDWMGNTGNLLNADFREMLRDQQRFGRRALNDLESGKLGEVPLREYLSEVGVGQFFIDHYLIPMAAAVWSSPDGNMLDFPTATFVTFWRNHGMLQMTHLPQWQTVVGGSHTYVKAFQRQFTGTVRTGTPVEYVSRDAENVVVRAAGQEMSFDRVVMASHADQTLKLLADPSPQERDLLGTWDYNCSHTVLHTDISVLPPSQRRWAAWNYIRDRDAKTDRPLTMSYWMNRLQGLKTQDNYIVTLNQTDQIDPERIVYETHYAHPVYTPSAISSQSGLGNLNGTRNTFYCGAYMRYGFHEDGALSGAKVAAEFGIEL